MTFLKSYISTLEFNLSFYKDHHLSKSDHDLSLSVVVYAGRFYSIFI